MTDPTPQQARMIGEKLRAARQEKQMSLRELAHKAEVSASMLSQVETGKVFPSVRSLYSIANALGVSVDFFFPEQNEESARASSNGSELTASEMRDARVSGTTPVDREFTPQSPAPIVYAHSRPTIQLNGGVTWSRLTAQAEKDAEFLEISYAPGAMSGANMSHHEGREFGYILEGQLIVELGFEKYTLNKGDSIIFESTVPHRLINPTSQTTRAVWVVLNKG